LEHDRTLSTLRKQQQTIPPRFFAPRQQSSSVCLPSSDRDKNGFFGPNRKIACHQPLAARGLASALQLSTASSH
jgi:hypothetical protein